MKTFFKIIKTTVITIVIIVVLVIAGLAIALSLPSVQKEIKKVVTAKMEEALNGRQVRFPDIKISILKGIVVENIEIKNLPNTPNLEGKPFVKCEAFIFKYDLLKLLQLKLEIDTLLLKNPEIYVSRYNKGKEAVFNFSDLMPPVPKQKPAVKKVEPQKTKPAKQAAMPKIKKSAIPIEIQVNKVGLEGAKIELTDTATPKFKEIYTLNNVHFLVSDIKIKANNPMKISTGFGMNVKEFKEGSKTDKDINLDTSITGWLSLFNKKGILDPTGEFDLELLNGKLTGLQAYEELLNQGESIKGSVDGYRNQVVSGLDKVKKAKEAGKYINVSKLNAAGEKLDKTDLSFLQKSLDWGFLKKTLEFDSVKTKLIIRDSKVISDNIDIKGKDLWGNGSGWTAFDTAINYNVKLIGDKKFNKNELTDAFANKDGNVELPILVTGTLSAAKVTFQKLNYMDAVKKSIGSRLGPEISGLLGDGSKQEILDNAKELAKQKVNEEKKKLEEKAKAEADAKKKELEDKAKAEAEAQKKKAADELKKKLPKF